MLRRCVCVVVVFIGTLLVPFLIASSLLSTLSANRLYVEPGVDVLTSVDPAFGDLLHLWWQVWIPGIAALAMVAACVILPRGREDVKNKLWRYSAICMLTILVGLAIAGPWIRGVVRVQKMPVFGGF